MKSLIVVALLALGCQTPLEQSSETFDAPGTLYAYDFVDPQGPPTGPVAVICTYRVDTHAVVRCLPQ